MTIRHDKAAGGDPLLGLLAVMVAVIVAATAWAARSSYQRSREQEASRLEIMTDVRAGRIAGWLREKMGQVRFAGDSPLGEQYVRWRDHGDIAIRDRMLGRLRKFAEAAGGVDALVMDDQGQVVAGAGGAAQAPAANLRDAARLALADGQPHLTDLYGYDGEAPAPRIDVLAPLTFSGQPPRASVVLRLDPAESLFPLMRDWPLLGTSTRAVLVRRQGDAIFYLDGKRQIPLSDPDLLVARMLRGDTPLGRAADATDYRGMPVLGVMQPIAGTDWYLAVMIDRDEAYAGGRDDAMWIAAAGFMALLAACACAYWFRGRQALRFARMAYADQERQRQHLEELVALRTCDLALKNASLERTVTDLEAFASSVSHDLRGPLHVISGFARVLELEEAAGISEKGRKRLGRIIASAITMDRMIEDILACSRAECVEMHFRQVDLNDVMRDVLHDAVPAFPSSRVVVSALPVVTADPALARQIFANLVGNALKFSARQEHPLVEIGMQDGGEHPAVFVRDNGVGFDPAYAHKLFAPFQRLHSEQDYPGTGVGLSIVKRLIDRHGGRISAQSQAGRTTFSFSFGGRGRRAS